jgi:hypothetical protein
MVKGRIASTAAAFVLALPIAAWAAPPNKVSPPAAPPDKAVPPDSAAAQLLRNCDAHKFETVVHDVVDGHPQASSVKLCGKEGQSDADWIGTLKDAIAKLNANKDMPQAVRDQIVTALRTEIARLDGSGPLLSNPSARGTSAFTTLTPAGPLPQKTTESASLPPARKPGPGSAISDDYPVLPTIPTPPPAPAQVLSGAVGASLPLLPPPRMSLTCFTPGEAEGPCSGFTRETQITVRAGEDLPAGTAVRFVRDSDSTADVDLPQLKKGRSATFNVPADVCRHVVGGKLELRIVRQGQEVGSEGPFNLNC